ncbi:uncharacterized protein LOC118179392 [Stegodyphus dumicola]|uniref:uncharacterized protein LOC118179392 n=1 Tax=Stegodyphus dumicola TaxID=202533 RepID=UPI0015AC27B4|nr:uncharacterized protein LOC118179392 [Stegodyphus dumicola]
MLLISAYCSPKPDLIFCLNDISRVLNKDLCNDFVICADFNAKSEVWGDQEEDIRGKQVLEFINSHGICILNNPDSPPTFEGARGSSWIDLTLVHTSINIDWRVITDISCSDHNYIEIDLGEKDYSPVMRKRFSLKNLNWIDFKKDASALLLQYNKLKIDEKNLEEIVERFAEEIVNICEKNKIKKKFKAKGSSVWWTKKLDLLRSNVRVVRRKFLCAFNLEDKLFLEDKYKRLRGIYKKEINIAKNQSWDDLCMKTNLDQPYGIPYKITVGKCKSALTLSRLKRDDGSETIQ